MRYFSKVNPVIYSTASMVSTSFKALAQKGIKISRYQENVTNERMSGRTAQKQYAPSTSPKYQHMTNY